VLNPFLHLESAAAIDPLGVFLETVDQQISYRDVLTQVKKIAAELRRMGMKPGDRVALDLPESLGILFSEAVFHEAGVGLILPRRLAEEEEFPVDWVFSSHEGPSHGAARRYHVDSAFLRRVDKNHTDLNARSYESAQSLCRVLFSSGTTGRPRAVGFSVEMVEFRSESAHSTWMQGEPFMSLFDSSTSSGFLAQRARVKRRLPLLVPGTPHEIVQMLVSKAVVWVMASPAQIGTLIEQVEAEGAALDSLRTIAVAGGILPPRLADRVLARMGSELVNIYGSTEAGMVAGRYGGYPDPFDAGHLTSGSEVQVVDGDDNELPSGQTGRIRYRRHLMATGYLNDHPAASESFQQGWFYPGDIGAVTYDGRLTVQGRDTDLLNAGGIKVDAVRLDLFALAQSGVVDACAFAAHDGSGLDQIGLAIVCDDAFDVGTFTALVREQFGPSAPNVIARVTAVPRNRVGKPMRSLLAEQFSDD